MAVPMLPRMAMPSAPPNSEHVSAETCSEFGGALGIAILGSIGTAIYRRAMADSIPDGIPAEAAAAARDTLGGALAAAGQLSHELGAALLETAREAFTRGLQLTAITSAVVAVGMAILVVVLLRQVRSPSEPERRAHRAS